MEFVCLWHTERRVSLTTMPISCVAPYKATVESVTVSSASRSHLVRLLTLVIPIASPALVVPLVALMRSIREGTVSARPCTEVWALDTGPGRGPCYTKLTWPDNRKETLRGGSGYHNENILCCCVVDRDEKDVEDNLPDFEAYPGHPRAEPFSVGEVSQGKQYEEDGRVCWLCAQSVYGGDTESMCPFVLTMVMSCDIAVSEMPSSYITVGSTKVIPNPPIP